MRGSGEDEALLRDSAALREVRLRYRGTLDPADVLRWRVDPTVLGSDGSRSPTARADDLRPLIYGRADTPERARERDAAIAEAEELLAGWAADTAALDTAIAAPQPAAARPRERRRNHRALIISVGAAAAAVAVVVVALLLLPRGLEPVAAPTGSPSPTASTTPSPTPTPTRTAPPASVAPPPVIVTPTPEVIDYRPDYYEDDIFAMPEVPINGAPMDNANCAATVDDYGVPLSCVVASGDVFDVIAKRFDLGPTYLAAINAVRREEPTVLYVGDVINLSANTILRVGDQNGVVYNFTDRMPDPHVEQY